MKCHNCGAEIGQDQLRCPYCGSENEPAAALENEREIAGIYAKTAALFRIPERAAKKAVRVSLMVVAVLLGAFVLVLIGSHIFVNAVPDSSYEAQTAELEELEELYARKDYDGLVKRLDTVENSYSATYGKYTTVCELYERLTYVEELCGETLELVADYPEGADLLVYDLEDLFTVLAVCESSREAGWIYGEQEALTEFEERAVSLLENSYLLTEDEISQGKAAAGEDEPDYLPLAHICAERLLGGAE